MNAQTCSCCLSFASFAARQELSELHHGDSQASVLVAGCQAGTLPRVHTDARYGMVDGTNASFSEVRARERRERVRKSVSNSLRQALCGTPFAIRTPDCCSGCRLDLSTSNLPVVSPPARQAGPGHRARRTHSSTKHHRELENRARAESPGGVLLQDQVEVSRKTMRVPDPSMYTAGPRGCTKRSAWSKTALRRARKRPCPTLCATSLCSRLSCF